MKTFAIIIAGEYRKLQSKVLAAGQTPKPGQLLMENADGELTAHATAGGYAERMLLLEDALQGKTVDDAYVAGEVADTALVIPGTETQVLIAAGQTIVKGDKLSSNGAGKFRKTVTTDVVLAIAVDAVDLSGSGAEDTLIPARWL